MAVELGKGLEEGERIRIVEVGVDVEVGTIGLPNFPVGILRLEVDIESMTLAVGKWN